MLGDCYPWPHLAKDRFKTEKTKVYSSRIDKLYQSVPERVPPQLWGSQTTDSMNVQFPLIHRTGIDIWNPAFIQKLHLPVKLTKTKLELFPYEPLEASQVGLHLLTSFLCVNCSPYVGKAITSPDTGAHGHFPSNIGGELVLFWKLRETKLTQRKSLSPCFVLNFYFNYDSFLKASIFNWRILALQCCASFCHTTAWVNHLFTSFQSLSHVWLFVTPWTAARQASRPSPTPGTYSNSSPLSQCCHPTISSSVIPFSSHLHSLPASGSFPMSQFFASGGLFCSFSFSSSPPNEYSELISFRMDWFDLFVVQGTLKSLLQHHSSKVSIIQCSAFSTAQLSHPNMITENP